VEDHSENALSPWAIACPEPEVNITLTYSGLLPACQGEEKHTDQKHIIRMAFNQQLKRKFELEPTLIQWSREISRATLVGSRVELAPKDLHSRCFYEVETCGFLGFPVVTSFNGLSCQLDIEILRRAKPGGVLAGGDKGGDIDNRLKPLLDALALPLKQNQVPGHMRGNGERLYCLLEDDALISRLTIDMQRWDEEPKTAQEIDHVQIRVRAHIEPFEPRIYHVGF
jgi:hypothetical protein